MQQQADLTKKEKSKKMANSKKLPDWMDKMDVRKARKERTSRKQKDNDIVLDEDTLEDLENLPAHLLRDLTGSNNIR